ncbi:MAG TPA: galactosyltransferase-related protein, partial [Phycisphaerales bacterium]|nr:galactosyltransferase-related protein [Phycisphaerales bacterium]
LLSESGCERHHALATTGHGLVIAFRAILDEAATAGLDRGAILSPSFSTAALLTPAEQESLRARHRRYQSQLRLRRLMPRPLCPVKSHKPKLISCHAAVSIAALRRVNAFDERFTAYGYEDDDLGQRLHALRPRLRVAIAVADITAFHLWHPTRAALRPRDNPGHARFAAPRPTRAEAGWSNPAPQPQPCAEVIPA